MMRVTEWRCIVSGIRTITLNPCSGKVNAHTPHCKMHRNFYRRFTTFHRCNYPAIHLHQAWRWMNTDFSDFSTVQIYQSLCQSAPGCVVKQLPPCQSCKVWHFGNMYAGSGDDFTSTARSPISRKFRRGQAHLEDSQLHLVGMPSTERRCRCIQRSRPF